MISIRPAREDEIQDLQILNDEVFTDNHKYDPDIFLGWAKSEKGRSYFAEVVSDQDSICLIAEDEGKKIGYIAAGPLHFDYRRSKYIEVQNMGVIPEYRSKGVGTMLLDECLKIAKSKGYQKAYVNSYIANTKAVDFYRKNGFLDIDICLDKVL